VLPEVAWKRDPRCGTFLWLAVVTGARRGELVAICWTDIRWQEADLLIARSYVSHRRQRVIKDSKTTRHDNCRWTRPRGRRVHHIEGLRLLDSSPLLSQGAEVIRAERRVDSNPIQLALALSC